MNSLLLGLALSTSSSAPAHPPAYPPPVVVVAPVRQVVYQPVFAPPAPPLPVIPVEPAVPVPPPYPGPVTVAEFARCFRPTPGTHHACLIHPKTGQPVQVCFTLPPGCPKVKVHRHELEFDYGRKEVEIHFRHNGTVHVEY